MKTAFSDNEPLILAFRWRRPCVSSRGEGTESWGINLFAACLINRPTFTSFDRKVNPLDWEFGGKRCQQNFLDSYRASSCVAANDIELITKTIKFLRALDYNFRWSMYSFHGEFHMTDNFLCCVVRCFGFWRKNFCALCRESETEEMLPTYSGVFSQQVLRQLGVKARARKNP